MVWTVNASQQMWRRGLRSPVSIYCAGGVVATAVYVSAEKAQTVAMAAVVAAEARLAGGTEAKEKPLCDTTVTCVTEDTRPKALTRRKKDAANLHDHVQRHVYTTASRLRDNVRWQVRVVYPVSFSLPRGQQCLP